MASSVFIESCTKPLKGDVGSEKEVTVSDCPDSNLVVVYGKKGVNFDHRGIENLIEEKTLSSISVIRLTSPTPSMIEEEEQAEKSEEFLRRQAEGLSDDESNRSSVGNSSSDNEVADNTGSEEIQTTDDEKSDADCESSADNGKLDIRKKKRKNRRKMNSKGKIQNIQNKLRKERPDIVGLTVEQFYPPVSAKEVVKEALKLAGVSTFKRTADYEFQLYVIKNDHCYTPYTSPAQMKAKQVEKYKAEKHAIIGRKMIPHTAITMKQIQLKKKVFQGSNDFVEQPNLQSVKDQGVKLNKTTCHKQENVYGNREGETGIVSSETESDFDILSEESGNTDNDRDSDLDFNVTNRKGRKKKDLVIKAKRLSAGKVCVKRHLQSHDEGDDQRNNIRTVTNNISNRSNKIVSPAKIAGCAPIGVQKLLSDAVAALPPIPRRSATAQIDEKAINQIARQQPIPNAIRRGPIIEVSGQKTSVRSQLQGSPQSVKEIIINKVMASPKGGFTEIGELLSQNGKQTPKKADPTTPTSSTKNPGNQLMVATSSSKGFMPLGVETAAKNKLPAQISIQTHQSSSELAAKTKVPVEMQTYIQPDTIQSNISTMQCSAKEKMSSELAAEQFDLIVSIVKDEMQKTAMMEASKPNESITKFNLDSNAAQSKLDSKHTNFGSTETTVDVIDISNAPLLETSEGDEIPDDLLQHVVDLIEDDKTLQEAVEKQVFGEDQSEGIASVGSSDQINIIMPSTVSRSIAPYTVQPHLSDSDSGPPKSIIEMAISNLPSTPTVVSSAGSNVSSVTSVQTPKATLTPTVRKEPIQIVRGNGRVITLPPIEAPTTRAKRRAQNQPVSAANSSTIFNESSMDSSIQSNTSLTLSEHVPSATVEKKNENKRRVSKESVAASAAAGKARKSVSSAKKGAAAKANASKTELEADVSGSQEDDDDPNRLWCICRQPHNNRFMICCDVCEDWFHGTCVSITKAMGIEMEQKGIEWTCPKCIKLQEEKKQRKITDMLVPKKVSSNVTSGKHEQVDLEVTSFEVVAPMTQSVETNFFEKPNLMEIKPASEAKKLSNQVANIKPSLKKTIAASKAVTPSLKKKIQASNSKQKMLNPVASQKRIIPDLQQHVKNKINTAKSSATIQTVNSPQQMSKDTQKFELSESTQNDENTFCIVCKKPARPNSIYCSDDCIRKHAQNALNMFAAASAVKSPEPTAVSSTNEEINAKKKKQKGLFEDILSMADRKPKVERVHVIERKSGRVLTGSNAPTTFNLKKWLQENQTFEVIQPGTFQAEGMEKKQKQRYTQPSPVITSSVGKHITQSPYITQNVQVPASPNSTGVSKTPSSQNEFDLILPVQKQVKQFSEQIAKTAPSSPRPGTPKQLQKYPQQVSIKPDKAVRSDLKEDTKERKEKLSKQRPVVDTVVKKHSENVAPVSTNSEPIRLNVRRTLKEQLLQRMNELGAESENGNKTGENLPKLSVEEIEKFVLETEAEMYEYFSRDTGSRYRAKYRSLMFNIKDRKNRTLFAKICTKIIQPKQLVRMSPEELASQELAQWRENEAKHQLEMIKKSELDLLSCAKNYVLKTHKGEEVIEGKLEDCVNLDVTIPVEDVVSVLNSSIVSSSSVIEENTKADMRSTPPSFDYQQNDGNRLEENKKTNSKEKERERDRDCERDRSREHGRDREHSRARSHDSDHSREKQRKNKDRHRDKSRSRKHSRSHTRSRSRSREKRHKSHHKEDRRDKGERDHDRDKFKEKDRDRDARSEKEGFDSRTIEKTPAADSPLNINSNKNSASSIKDKNKLRKVATSKPIETYSLIDQILESTKTVEEAANLISEREKLEEKEKERQKDPSRQTITPPLPTSSGNQLASQHIHTISIGNANDDQEPTSTVATPPQDPYIRYSDVDSPTLSGNVSSACIWNGNINMVDVASFQILIQPVVGNSLNLGTLLPDELDVVGRIGPDTVWEYISKIKKSPNKEIVIIRLIPASESETAAYKVLFQYLENRNRLGVINTVSPQIKDFYIYPLGAGKAMPPVLQPTETVDFYEDPYRPDILVGVVVRIIGKRHSAVSAISTSSSTSKSYRRGTETASFTPPGSPKRKKRIHASTPKVDEIDVDAIIKAPITTKAHKSTSIQITSVTDDADEPYSPGGSSDDDTLHTSKMTARSDEDELKRKMEELNRQIAAQEKEIAGLLNVESSCFATSSSSKTSAVLANISIPSNLSQILASIKSKPEGAQTQLSGTPLQPQTSVVNTATKTFSNVGQDEEYNPELVSFETSAKPAGKTSSRLAQLSEAELLSMVPDGLIDIPPVPQPQPSCKEIRKRFDEPPPPGV